MASGPDIRQKSLDLSELAWNTPAEALKRLEAFAEVVGIDPLAKGKPVPRKHELAILAALLDHLFPGGTTERLPLTGGTLSPKERAYLTSLVSESRRALQERQRTAPSTMLGFPDDTRGMWANLLGRSWIPWQAEWRGVLRS